MIQHRSFHSSADSESFVHLILLLQNAAEEVVATDVCPLLPG